eukprot:1352027-Amorphochlora_amoeboformis.AAC.1
MADVKGASSFRAKAEGNLIDSGEKDRIKEILRKKLVDAGWFEKLHAKCQDILKTKGLGHMKGNILMDLRISEEPLK